MEVHRLLPVLSVSLYDFNCYENLRSLTVANASTPLLRLSLCLNIEKSVCYERDQQYVKCKRQVKRILVT